MIRPGRIIKATTIDDLKPEEIKIKTTPQLILKKMRKTDSPARLAKELKKTQALVSQSMINLCRYGLLDRRPCECGRGYIYWKKV